MTHKLMMPELFMKGCLLGIALGWVNISARPGCTEHQIDEEWWMAINPHGEPCECSTGATVPPYSIYFMFNGWPFGVCDSGGGMCGAGSLANEVALVRAIERNIQRLEQAEKAKVQ